MAMWSVDVPSVFNRSAASFSLFLLKECYREQGCCAALIFEACANKSPSTSPTTSSKRQQPWERTRPRVRSQGFMHGLQFNSGRDDRAPYKCSRSSGKLSNRKQSHRGINSHCRYRPINKVRIKRRCGSTATCKLQDYSFAISRM